MNLSRYNGLPVKQIIILTIFLILSIKVNSQTSSIKYEVETQAIVTTNDVVPFWMRSNQFGSIPLSGISGSIITRAYKDYIPKSFKDSVNSKKKLIDWGFGFEGRANVGDGSNLQLIEAYGKLKVGIFQFKGGRSKDVMGLNGDTTLSSGNFSVSGNALGIPKIEISIPEYTYLPLFNDLIAVKGSFSYGWMGNMVTNPLSLERDGIIDKNEYTLKSNFHNKSLYGRIGRKNWKLNLYGGFNHQATWGGEKKLYGDYFTLSNFQAFLYAVQGKAYHSQGIPGSKMGNQIGSVDFGAEYNFNKIKIMGYHQSFYDIGGLYHLSNILDGLNGVSVANKSFNPNGNKFINWKSFVLEFFYSSNQGGGKGSKATPSGPEDYYNNYLYKQGWSYKGEGLGNPFITPFKYAKVGQAHQPYAYFINNRVIAFHSGFEGKVYDWDIKLKLSYSINHGLFATSAYSRLLGDKYIIRTENLFEKVNQFSFYGETGKYFNKSTYVGIAAAFDQGQLLNNSGGFLFKIKKNIN